MAYLYRHIRLDKNIPFYIGIGVDSNYYRANSKKSRNDHWNKIVNKTEYEVEILFEHDDYNFIKEKEKEFISLYGRKDTSNGMLVNKTDGGDGCLGLIHSDEAKLKMSIPNRGKIISQEQKIKVSEFHKGKFVSKETRIKISEDTRNKMISSAKRGSEKFSSKLTEEDVISIRKIYENKEHSHSKLAKIYRVSRSNIGSILNRNTWKHI